MRSDVLVAGCQLRFASNRRRYRLREPLRLDIEGSCVRSIIVLDADLRLADGARRFDIHDDANLHIDQIIIRRKKMLVRALRRSIGRPDRTARRTSALPGGSAERRVVEGCHILLHSSACGLRSRSLIHLNLGSTAACWRPPQSGSGINRKLLTTDQFRRNTCLNDTLKDLAENVAVTEPVIAGSREYRMVRNLVFDA